MNPGKPISFDGNDLQTISIQTADIDHHGGPNKDSVMYAIAHANYSAIPWSGYTGKTVTVTGRLVADSVADMDALEDVFKGYFIGKDKFLDIGHNGGTRRYICTPQSPIITRPNDLSYANFTLVFDVTYPFGLDTLATTALNATSRTLGTYADSLTMAGNAPVQWPVFTVSYSAITGGTSKAVVISNNANGQQITVTRTWTTGDVLQIDSRNRVVLINGTSIDFDGAFPELPPGSQSIGYSDNFTTRTFSINVAYNAQWM